MLKIDRSYRENLHTVLENHVPQSVIEKLNAKKQWKHGYNRECNMVVISFDGTIGQIIEIGGLNIALPSTPKSIRFDDIPQRDQKWSRYKVHDELMKFDKYYGKEKNIESKINEVFLRRKGFIDSDFKKIEEGDWFMNDGEPIYISGGYYFFLQHYYLPEDGVYPNFRMPQRDYFLWLEACYADERCVGSLLLKSRRSSFTVTSSSEILRDAIRYRNSYYPIMSDTKDHADTLFSNYIVRPFLTLPKHLQPMRIGNVIPKSEMVFESPKKKITTNSKASMEADGLNTTIQPRPTTGNAYDSTRPRKSLNDEIGKTTIDIVDWWAVHKKCHLEGKVLKGKAICGSTANPPNKGGKPYQTLYERSKLTTRGKSGFTTSGLYAIFIKADFAQTGFFDEYGYVIYHNPSEPVLSDIGEYTSQGAKEFLDDKEAQNADNINSLNFEKRNDPRVDTDAFLDEDATNMYATAGMVNLINFLKEYKKTDKYKTTVFAFDLVWKKGIVDGDVEMIPNSKGRFLAYANRGQLPIPVEFRNNSVMKNGKKAPVNGHLAALGVDPYQANRTQFGSGSKQGLVGMTTDTAELGDDYRESTFLYYNFRGETFEDSAEDVIKACVYFSIPALIERNKDGLIRLMINRGYRQYLMVNPLKKKSDLKDDDRILGGIVTSTANTDKQEQILETYIKTSFPEDINEDKIKCPFLELNENATEYTRANRSAKDPTVAWQLARIATNASVHKKQENPAEDINTTYERIIDLFKTEPTYN